uniref:Uncharacterized protein n=1 Tax=Rhizophora mucronata TaxID=61149 RepID=A0A2P2IZU9_RHIMU
MHIRQALT